MIPASHWHDNGDGTAWWVEPDGVDHAMVVYWRGLDRPCDTCGGDLDLAEPEGDCPDCIDGRHTFEIEVPCSNREWIKGDEKVCPTCHGGGKITFRVSVVKVEPEDDNTWRVLLRIHS